MSLQEANYLICLFCTRFNLSLRAKNELLKMIHLFIPNPNILPKNRRLIENQIIENKLDVITEYTFCILCSMRLDYQNVCNNRNCENLEILTKHYDSFHSVGITKQLTHIIYKN